MNGGDHFHPPAALSQGEEPQYPLYRRLSRPQRWSGWIWKRRFLASTELNPKLFRP